MAPRRGSLVAAAAALVGNLLVAPLAAGGLARPGRPEECVPVAAGADLQAALDAAPEGSALCLAPGVHAGPLRIARRLTLWGPADAVIRASGRGTTVRVEADGAALLGLAVDGSGGRFDLLDAAVRVEADDVRIENVTVTRALFGLLVERSRRVRLRGNQVTGAPDRPLGMRGDGIRLWEVRDSEVVENHMRDSRDMVVWYSPGNRFVGNRIEGGRYGTHFMYSHRNTVERNHYDRNVVGLFAMYSRDLRVRDNVIARSEGAAGVGLGAKESGNLEVAGNLFVGNTIGAYLDTSPLDRAHWNRFERNVFRLGETGVVFHSNVERNVFRENSFRDNHAHVRVEGRGDAMGAEWLHNDFDDYAGYDLDGDGLGDVPYELRSLAEQLVARKPVLAFFRGAPALALVELIGRIVPMFRPRTLLVDPEPRLGRSAGGPRRAG